MTGEPTHTAPKEMALCIPTTTYHLKSEVSITLHCQLYYTGLQIKKLFKKHLCNQNSHYENYRQFREAITLSPNQYLSLSAKIDETQRRTLVSL